MSNDRKNILPSTTKRLQANLLSLGLAFMSDHHQEVARHAALDGIVLVDYLARLAERELLLKRDRSTIRRLRNARFPLIKPLLRSHGSGKKINRPAVQNPFRLQVLDETPISSPWRRRPRQNVPAAVIKHH